MRESLAGAALLGGAFVLVVWAICAAFRRLPAWVKAWLWWIACAQFLARLFLTVPIEVPAPVLPPVREVVSAPTEKVTVITLPSQSTPAPDPVNENLLIQLWLVGIGVGVCVAGVRILGAWKLVKGASPLESEEARGILASLLREGERSPRLLESHAVKCPLLAGCLRPAIVAPSGYVEGHSPAEIRMAFAHELAHIRRHDQWLTMVVVAVQTVFFFHPLAWLAAKEAAIAREEACDADVLRQCGESAGAYAQFLLKSAQARTPVAALGAAYGYRNLRRRITMLTSTSNSSHRRTWLLMVAAGVVAALPWSVVAQQQAPGTPVKGPSKPAVVKKQTAKKPVKKSTAKAPNATMLPPTPAGMPSMAPQAGSPALAPSGISAASAPAAIPGMPAPLDPQIRSASAPGVVPPRKSGSRPLDAPVARSGSRPLDPTVARSANVSLPPLPGETSMALEARGPVPNASVPQGRPAALMNGDPLVEKVGEGRGLETLVNVRLERCDLEEALLALFGNSDTNFVIKAKIDREIISCGFKNVTVYEALTAILKGIDQKLTYRSEGGVIFIVQAE